MEEQEHINRRNYFEPIRGSIVILAAKLILTLLLFDWIYLGAYYILNLAFDIPFEWHHHISAVLFGSHLIKNVLEISFILYLTLSWANNMYLLTGKHLIRRRGIFGTQEDIFHFDNIRSISIYQSFLGKLFNYGDITLKTSASGGYQGDVIISEVSNPQKYEEILKGYF